MAFSNAEIQRRYRARCRDRDDAQVRLNTMISVSASAQLKRLSKQLKISQKAVLEILLVEAENKALEAMDRQAESAYFDITQ